MSDDELPELDNGKIGETAGQTLMRAIDHIAAIEENRGGTVRKVIVLFEVDHPPDEDHPLGSSTTASSHSPGMSRSEMIGLITYMSDSIRYDG